MKFFLTAVIFGVILDRSSAHQLKFGTCKPVKGMANFEPARFTGTWYVLRKIVTTSSCMMTEFGMEGDNILTVQELRTPFLSQMGPMDMTVTNVGMLVMNPSEKSSMRLNWEGNIFGDMASARFTVLDTDYDTYAVDFECQSLAIAHRISATIMSRTPTLPDGVMEQLEELLVSNKIDLDRLTPIDHSTCAPLDNNDFNVKVDGNGLSLLSLVQDEDIVKLKPEELEDYVRNNAQE